MTQPNHDPSFEIRPEYQPRPGETQAEALRYELLIIIDYAQQVGLSDDEIDEVLREVLDHRARERRKGFKVVSDDD